MTHDKMIAVLEGIRFIFTTGGFRDTALTQIISLAKRAKDVESIAKFLYELENSDNVDWEDFGNHSEIRELYLIKATAISEYLTGKE